MILFAFTGQKAIVAFVSDDRSAARRVMAMKEEICGMDVESLAKQVWAMQSKPDAVDFAAYSLQSDIRENLKRIYCHAKRVAKLQAHVDNAAAWTNRTSTEVQNEPQLAQVPAEAQA